MAGAEEEEQFREYFSTPKMQAELLTVIMEGKKSFNVDIQILARYNPDLADLILAKPNELKELAEKVINEIKPKLNENKNELAIRFYNSPFLFDVKDVGAKQLGKLINIEAVVSQTSDTKEQMCQALWECVHCGNTVKTIIKTNVTSILPPLFCPAPGCERTDFRLLEQPDKSEFQDWQKVTIQEFIEKTTSTITPILDCFVTDDLVNNAAPGEKLCLTGILWLKPEKGKKTPIYSKTFEITHIDKLDREFEQVDVSKEDIEKFNKLAAEPQLTKILVDSFATSIRGHDSIKEAILLQLFGGSKNATLADGTEFRSSIHILLIGDPGVAKSKMLEAACKVAPKSIFVGTGSSGVGLTASILQDTENGGWLVKAGALVLANGGIVCCDELDKIKQEERNAIHTALEQQRIAVNKAGFNLILPAKTTLLASANPTFGRFDKTQPFAQQFAIPPTLLSRFDLIFIMLDEAREEDDNAIAERITGNLSEPINAPLTTQELRKYIAYAKTNFNPKLTKEASKTAKDYYVQLRKRIGSNQAIPITARQLEGLLRLAGANAKKRLSQTIEIKDVNKAIEIMNFCLSTAFMDQLRGK